jgi:hypothetical protein
MFAGDTYLTHDSVSPAPHCFVCRMLVLTPELPCRSAFCIPSCCDLCSCPDAAGCQEAAQLWLQAQGEQCLPMLVESDLVCFALYVRGQTVRQRKELMQHRAPQANVRNYYMQFEETQTQSAIDDKIMSFAQHARPAMPLVRPPWLAN